MIHQPDYVKELIKKYIEGAITATELERLKACWKIYGEDELLGMTAEVLHAIGKLEPGDALESWEPDFAKIISNAQRIQRNKKILLYSKVAGAACLLLLVMTVNYLLFQKWPGNNATGECADMPSRAEIPGSEFACTIRWGDAACLTIDSNSTGLIMRVNNFEIRQEAPGVLALKHLAGATPVDTTRGRFMEVLTASRRQYIIKMGGSISVHLNAGSSLKLPFISASRDTCYVQVSGEAHIEMHSKGKPEKLIVETYNSQLQTIGSDFTVCALPGYTKATLIRGDLVAFSREGIHRKSMDCRGDQAVVKSYSTTNNAITDSIFFRRNSDVGEALVWTKTTRHYRNVSLKQFVLDMSRWYGFAVENIDCIPGRLRINTAICYRASQQQVYAEIRKAGIAVYEKEDRISFCDPAQKKHFPPAQTSFVKKVPHHTFIDPS